MTRESIRRRAGMGLAGALGAFALLAAYWAAGGWWGLLAAMGATTPFRPPAWFLGVFALLLTGWMMIVLGAIGAWGQTLPRRFFTVGSWVIAVTLLVISREYFGSHTAWERSMAAPLFLAMGLAGVVVAQGERRRWRVVFP